MYEEYIFGIVIRIINLTILIYYINLNEILIITHFESILNIEINGIDSY